MQKKEDCLVRLSWNLSRANLCANRISCAISCDLVAGGFRNRIYILFSIGVLSSCLRAVTYICAFLGAAPVLFYLYVVEYILVEA